MTVRDTEPSAIPQAGSQKDSPGGVPSKPEANAELRGLVERDYEHGFVTDIDQEFLPPGLNEDVVRAISAKKDEPAWLLEWRLDAYRKWLSSMNGKAPTRRVPIDHSVYSWKGYHSWADRVRQTWKPEDN